MYEQQDYFEEEKNLIIHWEEMFKLKEEIVLELELEPIKKKKKIKIKEVDINGHKRRKNRTS